MICRERKRKTERDKENLLRKAGFGSDFGYGHWHLSQVQRVQAPVSKSHSQQRFAAEIPPPIIDFCCSLPNFCAFFSTAFFVFMFLVFDC